MAISVLSPHLCLMVSKRPARGIIEAQHLLIRKEKNGIPLAGASIKAQKLYDQIKNGESTYERAVLVSSEDTETKGNKGNLGFFGIGQYDRAFEDAAFALANDGDISQPVETAIGYHIIRRVSKKPLRTKAQILENVKGKSVKGERYEKTRKVVVSSIKKQSGYKEDRSRLHEILGPNIDDTYYTYQWRPAEYTDGQIINYAEQVYMLSDFAAYVREQTKMRMKAKGQLTHQQLTDELFESFVDDMAIKYAESHLEERYPEFNNLMREYREGILLFDVTKDHVWDKAAQDTAAINTFFKANKELYKWDERVRITNYTIRSQEPVLVTKVMNASRNKNPQELRKLFNVEEDIVLHNKEVLEKTEKSLEKITLKPGSVTSPTFNNGLKIATFKKIEEIIPARQKTLKEARGYVISDYQDQLEEEWIADLRKEFKVKINKKTLSRLSK